MLTYFPGLFGFCPHLMTITTIMITAATATINITATTPPTIAPVLSFTREDWKVLATCGLDVTPLPALVLADTCMM